MWSWELLFLGRVLSLGPPLLHSLCSVQGVLPRLAPPAKQSGAELHLRVVVAAAVFDFLGAVKLFDQDKADELVGEDEVRE